MQKLRNPALERLEAGDLSLGVGVKHVRTVDVARIMKTCGFDWLFLDLEHGALTVDTTAQIAMAALDVGIAPIVRMPIGDFSVATRLLDSGAMGIIHPHIESADQAREVVDRLCFPPLGHRGVSGSIPQFGFGAVNLRDAISELNTKTLIAVMLETPEAVSQADEIAAIEGVDIVMIGTNDLALALGHPGEFDHPKVVSAYETVATACRRHNKYLGSGGVNAPDLVTRYVDMGVRFLLAAGDTGLVISSGQQRVKTLRNIKVNAA